MKPRIVGLTDKAVAKIRHLEAVQVPIEPGRTGDDERIPLYKYVWMRSSLKEQVEWLDHMIADFQRRKSEILNHEDNEEYFREYIQDSTIEPIEPTVREVVFLGLMNRPNPSEYMNLRPIHEYDWDSQEMINATEGYMCDDDCGCNGKVPVNECDTVPACEKCRLTVVQKER